MADLDKLRQKISDIDNKIMDLLVERMQAVREVGDYKKEKRLPIKDYKVEKKILDRARAHAQSAAISDAYIRDVMRTIIDHSVSEQDLIKQAREPGFNADAKTALIIGGGGHMGLWLAQFIESMGHHVTISDLDLSDPRCQKFHCVDRHENMDQNQFDWIFLATPMEVTAQLIDDLARSAVQATVVEICSLKQPIVKSLKHAQQKGMNIVSLHPMFGPDVNYLSGKNIVFCRTEGDDRVVEDIRSLFSETSAILIDIPIEQHDRMMSYVLGTSHFLNLVFAGILTSSNLSLAQLEKLAGTTFSRQLELTKGVSRENQNLYFDIQYLNAESSRIFSDFTGTFNDLMTFVRGNKRQEFLNFMDKCRTYLNSQSD